MIYWYLTKSLLFIGFLSVENESCPVNHVATVTRKHIYSKDYWWNNMIYYKDKIDEFESNKFHNWAVVEDDRRKKFERN